MESDWGRFWVKSSLLSSVFFLIGYIGFSIVDMYPQNSINILEIAFSYIFIVLIFFFLGIPLTMWVKKLVRNIPNKIIKELLSQILVTFLALFVTFMLTEFVFGGAYLSKENLIPAILLGYFSAIASFIGIKFSTD